MLTEAQRTARARGIGSSDAAAILGVDPHKTAYDLWLEKTGRVPGFEGNEHTERGNLLEPVILQMTEAKLGQKVVRPKSTYVRGILRANLDGQVEKSARGQPIVEAKSSIVRDGWGDPGTDQIPDRTLVQVHVGMLCAEADVAHVARLHDWYHFSLYHVTANGDLLHAIDEMTAEFWTKHVEADTPPPVTAPPSLELLSSIERNAGEVASVDQELVREFFLCRQQRLDAEKDESAAKSKLLAAMGDAEFAQAPGWDVGFTVVNAKRFNQTEFKKSHPELFEEFQRESPYRKLRVKETA